MGFRPISASRETTPCFSEAERYQNQSTGSEDRSRRAVSCTPTCCQHAKSFQVENLSNKFHTYEEPLTRSVSAQSDNPLINLNDPPDTETFEQELAQYPLACDKNMRNSLKSIPSVGNLDLLDGNCNLEEIKVNPVVTHDDDDNASETSEDTTEVEEEISQDTETVEIHYPHQLSIIYEENESAAANERRSSVCSRSSTLSDCSTTLMEEDNISIDEHSGDDLEDENSNSVTVRLPLKFSFTRSKDDMINTTLTVGESESEFNENQEKSPEKDISASLVPIGSTHSHSLSNNSSANDISVTVSLKSKSKSKTPERLVPPTLATVECDNIEEVDDAECSVNISLPRRKSKSIELEEIRKRQRKDSENSEMSVNENSSENKVHIDNSLYTSLDALEEIKKGMAEITNSLFSKICTLRKSAINIPEQERNRSGSVSYIESIESDEENEIEDEELPSDNQNLKEVEQEALIELEPEELPDVEEEEAVFGSQDMSDMLQKVSENLQEYLMHPHEMSTISEETSLDLENEQENESSSKVDLQLELNSSKEPENIEPEEEEEVDFWSQIVNKNQDTDYNLSKTSTHSSRYWFEEETDVAQTPPKDDGFAKYETNDVTTSVSFVSIDDAATIENEENEEDGFDFWKDYDSDGDYGMKASKFFKSEMKEQCEESEEPENTEVSIYEDPMGQFNEQEESDIDSYPQFSQDVLKQKCDSKGSSKRNSMETANGYPEIVDTEEDIMEVIENDTANNEEINESMEVQHSCQTSAFSFEHKPAEALNSESDNENECPEEVESNAKRPGTPYSKAWENKSEFDDDSDTESCKAFDQKNKDQLESKAAQELEVIDKEVELNGNQLELERNRMEKEGSQVVLERNPLEVEKNNMELNENGMEVQRNQMELEKNQLELKENGMEVQRNQLELEKNQMELEKNQMEVEINEQELASDEEWTEEEVEVTDDSETEQEPELKVPIKEVASQEHKPKPNLLPQEQESDSEYEEESEEELELDKKPQEVIQKKITELPPEPKENDSGSDTEDESEDSENEIQAQPSPVQAASPLLSSSSRIIKGRSLVNVNSFIQSESDKVALKELKQKMDSECNKDESSDSSDSSSDEEEADEDVKETEVKEPVQPLHITSISSNQIEITHSNDDCHDILTPQIISNDLDHKVLLSDLKEIHSVDSKSNMTSESGISFENNDPDSEDGYEEESEDENVMNSNEKTLQEPKIPQLSTFDEHQHDDNSNEIKVNVKGKISMFERAMSEEKVIERKEVPKVSAKYSFRHRESSEPPAQLSLPVTNGTRAVSEVKESPKNQKLLDLINNRKSLPPTVTEYEPFDQKFKMSSLETEPDATEKRENYRRFGHSKAKESPLVRSIEESGEEDSGVTSDFCAKQHSENETDSENFPELRKLSRYERASTHSRLYKLLQGDDDIPEQIEPQPDETPKESTRIPYKSKKIIHNVSVTRRQNPQAVPQAETMEERRQRLCLPLHQSSSGAESMSSSTTPSPTPINEKLVNELVQSLLSQKRGKMFKNLPIEKLHAAAIKILQEDMESNATFSSADESTVPTVDSTPALTPQEFRNNSSYTEYYDSWQAKDGTDDLTDIQLIQSKAFKSLQEQQNNSNKKLWSARCPRILSSKSINKDLARLSEVRESESPEPNHSRSPSIRSMSTEPMSGENRITSNHQTHQERQKVAANT